MYVFKKYWTDLLNVLRFGLKRFSFLEDSSFAVMNSPWIQYLLQLISGQKVRRKQMFLRHGGFLGALGAYTRYQKEGSGESMSHQLIEKLPNGVQCAGDNQPSGLPADLKSQ